MMARLYRNGLSPPSRAVMLAEKALGLRFEHVNVDILKGEQLRPEFLEINPQHTIPVLIEDDGTVICDSHAIMSYLADKYCEDTPLYPKDLVQRALIQRRMYFDCGCIFILVRNIVEAIWDKSSLSVDFRNKSLAYRYYDFLEQFLEGQEWVAGGCVTLADLSLLSSVTTLDVLVPINVKYSNISGWIKRAEQLEYYQINRDGIREFEKFIETLSESTNSLNF